jgi:muramoyltetrapeptide carboxypeptidase
MNRISKPLVKGDTIALITPAYAPLEGNVAAITNFWNEAGYKTNYIPLKPYHLFAGTDVERAVQLQNALDADDIGAIHMVRGGYGCTRFLDALDWTKFEKEPKWVIGYSDGTALHSVLTNKGIASIHGPMGRQLGDTHYGDFNGRGLLNVCTNRFEDWKVEWDGGVDDLSIPRQNSVAEGEEVRKVVEVTGIVTGGNLTLLTHMCGTPNTVNTDGKILFIEEIGEPWYQIDRLLLQLEKNGLLFNLAALIVGSISEAPERSTDFGMGLNEIIHRYTHRYSYPVAMGYPGGHGAEHVALPMGVRLLLAKTETGWSLNKAGATVMV